MRVGPLALSAAIVAALGSIVLAGVGGAALSRSIAPGAAIAGIPPNYLAAYREASDRFSLGTDGWSYLAAIGRVESDHGQSTAPGVHSGQNAHGCCAGPMQIHNGFGSGGGTWGAFKVDGDGDGRVDIYDPDDAVATGASYLRASGAPGDWRVAIFAYNHADWYVDRVVRQAAAYREREQTTSVFLGEPDRGGWLAPVPGFPGERCDRRIVADVVFVTTRYGVRLTDCFGGAPHALNGEHPLGVAADLVPIDGDWDRTARLAADFGWSRSCAASGCANRGPFRVLLYNGFPGHGDPSSTRTPHLHVSWEHGRAEPFAPVPWVRVLLSPGSASP
jgi:hypothetical protein